MSLQQLRDFITSYMRNPRIPTEMLDAWIGDAVLRILTEAEWRWLTNTISVEVTRAAPLSSSTYIPDAQTILSVALVGEAQGGPLENILWDEAFDTFPNVRPTSSRPTHYSVVADTNTDGEPILGVRLWEPSSVRTEDEVVVRYRRTLPMFPALIEITEEVEVPQDDGSTTTETRGTGTFETDATQKIPLPNALMPAVKNFTLAEALQADGRSEDAQAQLHRYRQAVDRARPRLMLTSGAALTIGDNRLGV